MALKSTLLILFHFAICIQASRILAVFPFPSISHQVVFRPLTTELAKRGHEVVVVTTDLAFPNGNAPENLTEIDIHDISYSTWRRFFMETNHNNDYWSNHINLSLSTVCRVFEEELRTDVIQDLLKLDSDHFDLVLIEHITKPDLVFSYVFNAPVIQISSLGLVDNKFDLYGAPGHPLIYPCTMRQRIHNLSKWEKIMELYHDYNYNKLIEYIDKKNNEMLRRNFGPNVPSLYELSNNVDMLFVNLHPLWDGNRPVPPNVIYVGGLHQQTENELPKDLKAYLDSSKNGVIYLSFGTNAKPSLFSNETIDIFLRTFSRLPYNVLWKWDKEELPGRTDKIKIGKWFPQSDLLRHKNVKAFITQCGLQSTDEAILAGVPLIGIPLLFDQFYNAEKYVYHRIGVKLNLETLTEEIFYNATKTVIEDESYHRNIQRLRDLMLDQPQTSLERAVWWTEYVLRHDGAKHLRGPEALMSWAEFLELELVSLFLILLFIICVGMYAVVKILRYFLSKILTEKVKIKLS